MACGELTCQPGILSCSGQFFVVGERWPVRCWPVQEINISGSIWSRWRWNETAATQVWRHRWCRWWRIVDVSVVWMLVGGLMMMMWFNCLLLMMLVVLHPAIEQGWACTTLEETVSKWERGSDTRLRCTSSLDRGCGSWWWRQRVGIQVLLTVTSRYVEQRSRSGRWAREICRSHCVTWGVTWGVTYRITCLSETTLEFGSFVTVVQYIRHREWRHRFNWTEVGHSRVDPARYTVYQSVSWYNIKVLVDMISKC